MKEKNMINTTINLMCAVLVGAICSKDLQASSITLISGLEKGYRNSISVIRNDFRCPADVEAALDTNVTSLSLVHHKIFPDNFSLLFLNNYPNMKILRLSADKIIDPENLYLSDLRYITNLSICFGRVQWDKVWISPHLEYLQTEIEHLEYLEEIPNLISLYINQRHPSLHYDLAPISQYHLTLKYLSLHVEKISDSSALSLLTNLEELHSYGAGLESEFFSFIGDLKALKFLRVYYAKNFNFSVFDNPQLETLELSIVYFGEENTLENLSSCPQLKNLELGNARGGIPDLSPLMACTTWKFSNYLCGHVMRLLPLIPYCLFPH